MRHTGNRIGGSNPSLSAKTALCAAGALAGPFPPGIQGGVMFSTAAHAATKNKPAAEDIIRSLVTPGAREKFKSAGFDMP
jgi:hypothetical protein